MTERDRVLDAFRNCITEPKCKDCPWTECETIGHDTIEIPRDLALAVMRELVAQEPVEPDVKMIGCGKRYYCGGCKASIEPNHKFCRACGRAVKWDD